MVHSTWNHYISSKMNYFLCVVMLFTCNEQKLATLANICFKSGQWWCGHNFSRFLCPSRTRGVSLRGRHRVLDCNFVLNRVMACHIHNPEPHSYRRNSETLQIPWINAWCVVLNHCGYIHIDNNTTSQIMYQILFIEMENCCS